VLEALSNSCKVVQRWDTYKTDAGAIAASAKNIMQAAEIIEAAGGDSDSFLGALGITAEQLTLFAGMSNNDAVSVP
jgi:hypothetical protein